MVDVSLFASSVRPKLYNDFFRSLEFTTVEYEVVFAGHCTPNEYREYEIQYGLKYIQTGKIKPSQCYEIARRHCQGEVIVWVADDCAFPNDVIGKAYRDLARAGAIYRLNGPEWWVVSTDKRGGNAGKQARVWRRRVVGS
jgi:hypothetical protein